MCTVLVETHTIEAFLSCCLILLDKNSGPRPIGVCQVSRKVAGKAIVLVLKEDIIKYTGRLQVCAKQEVGIEAAIHSMNMIYEDENTHAILLADAKKCIQFIEQTIIFA